MTISKTDAEEKIEEKSALSTFEKFLAVWVAICMGIGLLLSQFIPNLSEAIDNLKIAGISLPIGICLFLMMYPAMLNLQGEELKKLGKNPKPIVLTLISNWIIAPVVAFGLSKIFLNDDPQLFTAVILLGSSPCTAMVLVWGALAEGNQEQNVVNTSLNTITIMILYAPIVSLFTGIQNIPIDRVELFVSVLIFIGIPLVLGIVSKKLLVEKKGSDWFNKKYRPAVGKISIVALLTTLVVLFSLNGEVLINYPNQLILVSVPLILGFVIVVGVNLIITKYAKLEYKQAIITVIIGSSSHFEIAIATAVTVYGVGSIAALGTTMGLFWEVPIMLGLVYFGKYLRKRGYWRHGEIKTPQKTI